MCALAMALALAGCSAGPLAGHDTAGPVEFEGGTEVRAAASILAEGGDVVVFGLANIRNTGDDPARLEGASLIGPVPASAAAPIEFRVLDRTEHQRAGVGAAHWPFGRLPELSVPLHDYELPGGKEVDLIIVVKVNQTGDWYWSGASLSYSVNGTAHSTATSLGFQVCPPRTSDCVPPWAD